MNLHIRISKEQKKQYEDAAYRYRLSLSDWVRQELDNAATYNPPVLSEKKISFKPRTFGASTEGDVIDVGRL